MMLGVDLASVDANARPRWQLAKQAGIRFVIFRGVYGRPFEAGLGPSVDPSFVRDYDDAGRSGIVRGAYLFLCFPRKGWRTPPAPDAQANALLQALAAHRRMPTDLPPVLDVEFPGEGRKETGLSAAQCLDWVRVAWRTLRDGCQNVPPIIYTSARVWREDLQDIGAADLTDSPLWLARYPFKTMINAVRDAQTVDQLAWPPTPKPWGNDNCWLHQYQGDALAVPGFSSTVDLNRFHVLSEGATGERVRWMQRRLGRVETGVWDPDLTKVVREFQRLSGLEADGVVGIRTFSALCWSVGVERLEAA